MFYKLAVPKLLFWTSNPFLLSVGLILSIFMLTGLGLTARASAEVGSQSLWAANVVPKNTNVDDPQGVELGIKFKSASGGLVTGIRFYKGSNNTGSHQGSLWTADGKKIASVDFVNETPSGWQLANFSTPINIIANTTYVVSYYAPNGNYAANNNYFSKTYFNGLLSAGKNAGVYKYSKTSTFPVSSYAASNYWVDVVFLAGSASPIIKPSAPTNLQAQAQTDGVVLSWSASVSSGVTQSIILRDGLPIVTIGSSATSYKDTTVEKGKTYQYQIKAVNANGVSSDPSNLVNVTMVLDPVVPPSANKDCAVKPSACGFPDETNTGVPFGIVLREVGAEKLQSGPGWHFDSRGWLTVDGDGAVLDGLDIPYNVDINANNVTIKNSRIVTSGDGFGVSIRHAANTVIQDSTIYSPTAGDDRLMVGIKDIYADSSGTKVLRNNIYHVTTGVQLESGLIQDNYIHDMGIREGDHINGTTSNGGTDQLTIRHNTIFNQISQTDAISLFEDFGVQANRTIDNNLVAGGSYSIYAGQNPGGPASYNIKITNNRYSKKFFNKGGEYGPYTGWLATGQGNVMTGNVWDDTGLAAN